MWKIAIVDDERQVLKGMKGAIPWDELGAEWGGEALNGEDGLLMISDVQPDIVITDLYMPVMSGIEMIQHLRNQGYQGKIIILSGYSDFEHARQALRFGVSDYISKPISLPTLRTLLSKVIRELEEEEKKRIVVGELEFKMRLYEPFVEKEWVRSVAVGTLDELYKENERIPPPYQYWLERKHFTVGIELIRDQRANCLSLSDWNLFRFAVSNIACEVAGKFFSEMEYTELHSTRALLIIHPDPHCVERVQREQLESREQSDILEQQLEHLGTMLIQSIGRYLKLSARIGIGGLKDFWTQISDSTEEAFRAMDDRALRITAACEVYMYRENENIEQGKVHLFPVKFCYKLATAIKSSQETEAHQLVSSYMLEIKKQHTISQRALQLMASELWGVITYSLYEAGQELDEFFNHDDIVKEIDSLLGLDQLQQWLANKITQIFNSRQWKGSSKHRQIVEFMTGYIHEHYAKELTLAELSDKVFISRNHLAIIFKSFTGETFNNYLTRVRIEKARELLLERNMLVYEVAERVGYKNIPYFSTLFKKITGMNPTELINN